MLSSRSPNLPQTFRFSPNDAVYSPSTCSTSSDGDDDDDAVNHRVYPSWCSYRHVIQRHGYRLDTCRDVKQLYQRYWEALATQGNLVSKDLPGYLRACSGSSDDELCPDIGLPDNLFRGTRCMDGTPVVIKAVHFRSREYDVVRYLSSPPVREHPMNHCIPVLDRIELPSDELAFIVMEEWSPHLDTDPPRTLQGFLRIIRQHLEHIAFMHAHRIAHLDISVHNMLTDSKEHYACIDFEISHRFDVAHPRIRCLRSSEVPPEVERGESCDPYKIDVWASGMLILRASQLTGHQPQEVQSFTARMLDGDPVRRPTALQALAIFDSTFRATSTQKMVDRDALHPQKPSNAGP